MQIYNITDPRVVEISQKVVQAAKETLGEKLDKVILYGSYARGDNDDESDLDFFILADVPQEEAGDRRSDIRDCIPLIDLEFDITVSLHVTGRTVFNKFLDSLPYYMNVIREGIVLHG